VEYAGWKISTRDGFFSQRFLRTSEVLLHAELAAPEALPDHALTLRRIVKRTARQNGHPAPFDLDELSAWQLIAVSANIRNVNMHTLGNMAKALNRSAVYLQGLQKRFELPIFKGANYSDSYLLFLQTVITLRTLNVPEEAILELWRIERKLPQLLHADTTGSPTWFLDSCGSRRKRNHRLLLSNFDLGVYLAPGTLQLGQQFSETAKELFTGSEMGEDVLALLDAYLKTSSAIRSSISAEIPQLRTALRFAKQFSPRS